MRYDMYMQRPTKIIMPGAMICVDVTADTDVDNSNATLSAERLKTWHISTLQFSEDKYTCCRQHSGVDSGDFWRTLAAIINKHKNPWVLSYHCGIVWSLLSLWDAIEDGEISIAGRDPRYPNIRFRRKGEAIPGFIVIEDPPNILKFNHAATNKAATWVDLRNYGVEPPAHIHDGGDMCEWLGLWYQEAYKLVCELQLGSWKPTAGSQAFNGWRQSYLNTGIYCHVNSEAVGLEASGYYGGRCEPFQIGNICHRVTQVDFRSMYPSICRDIGLPVRLCGTSTNEFTASDIANSNPRRCIAEVTIRTDEPLYPCHVRLPLDCQATSQGRAGLVAPVGHDREIIYPVGTFRTVLAGPELEDALHHNCVKEIHGVAYYEMEKCLHDYATTIYGVRCRHDVGRDYSKAQYIKRLLVSIVGKLGQRERYWQECPGHQTDIYYGTWYGANERGGICRYRAIAGNVQRDRELGFAPNTAPAIAAWITSEGRCRLLKTIRQAGFREVHYVDTDGLIVSQLGLQRIAAADYIRDCELGYLRHVSTTEGADIYGIKDYRMGEKIVRSGVPRSSLNCAPGSVRSVMRRTIREDLYSRIRPTAARSATMPVRHELYRHGVVQEGGRVRPWIVKEDGSLA